MSKEELVTRLTIWTMYLIFFCIATPIVAVVIGFSIKIVNFIAGAR